MRRLLVIRKDKLGDSLLATPILRAIRGAAPEVQVSLLCQPQWRCVFNGLGIAKIWAARRGLPVWNLAQIAAAERAAGVECCLLLPGHDRRHELLSTLCGARRRVAAASEAQTTYPNIRVGKAYDEADHQVRKYLALASAALERQLPELEAVFPGDHPGPSIAEHFAVVHVGTGGVNRALSAEGYLRLTQIARRSFDTVALTGMAGAVRLGSLAKALPGVVDLIGGTSIGELAGVFKRASVLISVDCGAVHLAAAMGAPCVALYPRLCISPERWRPWKVPHAILRSSRRCAGCTPTACEPETDDCIESFDMDAVEASLRELINRSPPSSETSKVPGSKTPDSARP